MRALRSDRAASIHIEVSRALKAYLLIKVARQPQLSQVVLEKFEMSLGTPKNPGSLPEKPSEPFSLRNLQTAVGDVLDPVIRSLQGGRLPAPEEQARLERLGKALRLTNSTTGPVQKHDPRAFVTNIKYAGTMQFMLVLPMKEHDQYCGEHKYQVRETKLYSFLDAAGQTGYMIKNGPNAMLLTDVKSRAQAGKLLNASFLPNYFGSPGDRKARENDALSDSLNVYYDRSISDGIIRASIPVRQSFTREYGCGGPC